MTEELPHGGGGHRQETLDVTRALAVLSSAQRRQLLYYLLEETDGVADVEHLIDRIGAVGIDAPGTDEELHARLHHQHLPKMEELGVIEYDVHSSTVRYREDEIVEEVLSAVAAYDRAADG